VPDDAIHNRMADAEQLTFLKNVYLKNTATGRGIARGGNAEVATTSSAGTGMRAARAQKRRRGDERQDH
jgi:hypothetical protein